MLSISDLKFEDEIGIGSFGTVFRAIRKDNNGEVAVKVLKDEKQAQNEATLLKIASSPDHHPFILDFYGFFVHNDLYCIVEEYVSGGQLLNYLSASTEIKETLVKFMKEGLQYLHSKRIAHRDVKLENILCSKDQVKLIDLGLSCSDTVGDLDACNIGTPFYMATERIHQIALAHQHKKKKYNYNTLEMWMISDIFSFGIVVYEIASGSAVKKDPLGDVKDPKSCQYSASRGIFIFPTEIDLALIESTYLKNLIQKCLEPNPLKRSFEI